VDCQKVLVTCVIIVMPEIKNEATITSKQEVKPEDQG